MFETFNTSPNKDSRCSVSFSRKLSFRSSNALLRPANRKGVECDNMRETLMTVIAQRHGKCF
jgi:hypothetical protein